MIISPNFILEFNLILDSGNQGGFANAGRTFGIFFADEDIVLP